MKLADALADLKSHRRDQIAQIYSRRSPGVETWGVCFGDMNKLAKQIKSDSEIAFALWDVQVLEPRVLALKILDPAALDEGRIDTRVEEIDFPILADLFSEAVYWTPVTDTRRAAWTQSRSEFIRRAGFCLDYLTASDPANPISDDGLRDYLGLCRSRDAPFGELGARDGEHGSRRHRQAKWCALSRCRRHGPKVGAGGRVSWRQDQLQGGQCSRHTGEPADNRKNIETAPSEVIAHKIRPVARAGPSI